MRSGMHVIMQLDDETFWRYPTECNYLVWYAPAVGASVREEKRSQWRDKGGAGRDGDITRDRTRSSSSVSFTRGR